MLVAKLNHYKEKTNTNIRTVVMGGFVIICKFSFSFVISDTEKNGTQRSTVVYKHYMNWFSFTIGKTHGVWLYPFTAISNQAISTAEGERCSPNTTVSRGGSAGVDLCVFCVSVCVSVCVYICVLSWKLRCSQAKCEEGYVRQREKEWDKDLRAHTVNSCRASWSEKK